MKKILFLFFILCFFGGYCQVDTLFQKVIYTFPKEDKEDRTIDRLSIDCLGLLRTNQNDYLMTRLEKNYIATQGLTSTTVVIECMNALCDHKWDYKFKKVDKLKNIIEGKDGYYILFDRSNRITKLSKSGQLIFEKSYEHPTEKGYAYTITDISILSDETLFFVGHSANVANIDYEDLWVWQTDNLGNILSRKNLGTTSILGHPKRIKVDMDGSYYILTEKRDESSYDYTTVVMKFSQSNERLWTNEISDYQLTYNGNLCINNNSVFITGYSPNNKNGGIIEISKLKGNRISNFGNIQKSFVCTDSMLVGISNDGLYVILDKCNAKMIPIISKKNPILLVTPPSKDGVISIITSGLKEDKSSYYKLVKLNLLPTYKGLINEIRSNEKNVTTFSCKQDTVVTLSFCQNYDLLFSSGVKVIFNIPYQNGYIWSLLYDKSNQDYGLFSDKPNALNKEKNVYEYEVSNETDRPLHCVFKLK